MLEFPDGHNLSESNSSDTCVYYDCYRTASYNFPGKKERLYVLNTRGRDDARM